MSAQILSQIFKHLTPSHKIFLDSKVVEVSCDPTGFIACVRDEGNGVRVYGCQDKQISEIFRNGIALRKKYYVQ